MIKNNLRVSKFKKLEHLYGLVLSIESNPTNEKERALILGVGDDDILKLKKMAS